VALDAVEGKVDGGDRPRARGDVGPQPSPFRRSMIVAHEGAVAHAAAAIRSQAAEIAHVDAALPLEVPHVGRCPGSGGCA
jgi:hypothetical protein